MALWLFLNTIQKLPLQKATLALASSCFVVCPVAAATLSPSKYFFSYSYQRSEGAQKKQQNLIMPPHLSL